MDGAPITPTGPDPARRGPARTGTCERAYSDAVQTPDAPTEQWIFRPPLRTGSG